MKPLRHFRYISSDKADMIVEQLSSRRFLGSLKLALELPFFKVQGDVETSREPVRQALRAIRLLTKSKRLKGVDSYTWPGQDSFFQYRGAGLDDLFVARKGVEFPGFYQACAIHNKTLIVLVGSLKNTLGSGPHLTEVYPFSTDPIVSAFVSLFGALQGLSAEESNTLGLDERTIQYLTLGLARRLARSDGLQMEAIFKIVAEFDLAPVRRWQWDRLEEMRSTEHLNRLLVGTPLFVALR